MLARPGPLRLQPGQTSDPCLLQGPLSLFSAKNRWRLVGPIHLTRGEGGFGFTLRGDSPVLVAAVVPGGQAAVRAPLAFEAKSLGCRPKPAVATSLVCIPSLQAAGLQQGDYIVSVNGQSCKWWRHADVVAQLREAGEAGVSLQVASLLPRCDPCSAVSWGPGGTRVLALPWAWTFPGCPRGL